jgi:hypothetical protein
MENTTSSQPALCVRAKMRASPARRIASPRAVSR